MATSKIPRMATGAEIDALSTGITNNLFKTVSTISDFVGLFDKTKQARTCAVEGELALALLGEARLGLVTGYKTQDNAYIVWYGTNNIPRFFSGYVTLSDNSVTTNQMYAIRKVRCKFTGVSCTAGGYVRLTNGYSSVLPSGLNSNNIVSSNIFSGTFIGIQMLEFYEGGDDSGIYLYSSHSYSNKSIAIDIFYSPYTVIQTDAEKNLTPP